MSTKKYTKADMKEFDRLVRLMESPRQLDRIHGRLEWRKFSERFDKPTLDEMWEQVKTWK